MKIPEIFEGKKFPGFFISDGRKEQFLIDNISSFGSLKMKKFCFSSSAT